MNKLVQIPNRSGFTLVEILIALLITGILASAGFSFYAKMSHQANVQFDVSEMQHQCRMCLLEIRKSLRSAGYMLTAHPAYEISGDSLSVYFSDTQPVDTVRYFLQEYSALDYSQGPVLPAGIIMNYLMKQENNAAPVALADAIASVNFNAVTPSTVIITITTQVPREDDEFSANMGFRTFTLTERVNIRNIN